MGVFSTGTEKGSITGFSLLKVRTGEKIGAQLRLISINLSIGGISPFFHIRNFMLLRIGRKIVRIRLRVLIIENGKLAKSHFLLDTQNARCPIQYFFTSLEKIDLHIGVLAGFRGFKRVIVSGKNSIDCRAIGRHLARCKSALFWQTERKLSVFSTRTEKEGFTGFFAHKITIRE